MVKSARYEWKTIRALCEARTTRGQPARGHGADKAAVRRRAEKEGGAKVRDMPQAKLPEGV